MSQNKTVTIANTGTRETDLSRPSLVGNHASFSPLLKLARVEVQSIMQFLLRLDLLHLSRCSRTLLADGDTDVAWRTQPLYEIDFGVVADKKEELFEQYRTPSLFMRRQPGFSLSGQIDRKRVKLETILTLLELIPRIHRFIYQTVVPGSYTNPGDWNSILNHAGLDDLRELQLMCTCCDLHSSRLLGHIERLSKLQALTFPSCLEYDSVVGLRAFPRLTALDILEDAQLPRGEVTILTSIMKCEHLVSLCVASPLMLPERFHTIFSSTNLSRLRELGLSHWQWFDEAGVHIDKAGVVHALDGSIIFDHLRRTWNSMTCLERLMLVEVPRINSILPTLTSGHFQELFFKWPLYVLKHCVPDDARLVELLTHKPDLSITVSTVDSVNPYRALESTYVHQFRCILHPSMQSYDAWAPPPLELTEPPWLVAPETRPPSQQSQSPACQLNGLDAANNRIHPPDRMISTSITGCATRPRSTHTCVDDLAQVEIRWIMNFLTGYELIQFSCSSKQLLNDGSSTEAFKFIALKMVVTVGGATPSTTSTSTTTQLGDQRIEDLALSYASSTMSRTPVSISIHRTQPLHPPPHSSLSPPSSVCARMGLRRFIQSCDLTLNLPIKHPPLTIEWLDSILLRLPHIISFTLAFHLTPRGLGYARADVWQLILSHPAFNDLEEFHCALVRTSDPYASDFYLDDTDQCLRPFQRMKQLTALQLPCSYVSTPVIAQLSLLPHTRSITYYDQTDYQISRPLTFTLLTDPKLVHLTSLDARESKWYREQIGALVTPTDSVPLNRNIRELTLRRFYISDFDFEEMVQPNSNDFDAFFGFMTGLVKLTIDSSDVRDVLILSSMHSPLLTNLILKGYPDHPPDVTLLADLLDQRPSLHITLHITLATLQEYDTNQAEMRAYEIEHGLERGVSNRGRSARRARGRGRSSTTVTDDCDTGVGGRLSARTIIVDTYTLLIEHYPSFHRLDPDERK